MISSDGWRRLYWPLVSLFAVSVYAYSLDGLYIPHIGDEAPYIEIARLTAESGAWLPLQTAPGLENTKPPGLFWLGIVSTGWAESFTLFRLRLPILLCTFLTAILTFAVARRITGDLDSGYLAGLTFLGFYSSYQYGRPFLTNLPETLFVFLGYALVLVARDGRSRSWVWGLAGVSLGIACLFKSFALVFPAGLAFCWYALVCRRFDWRGFARIDVPGIVLATILALACFAIWPLLDPAPGEIVRHFVLEENVGKLGGAPGGDGYLWGLVSGPYSLPRLWLGQFANAGLFALPLAFVVVAGWRGRARASLEEKGLWILVLGFLIVYSFPSQRQENYLLPSVPALAVLIAMRWREIGSGWMRVFAIPGLVVVALLLRLVLAMRVEVLPPGSYDAAEWVVPALVLAGWIGFLVRPGLGAGGFHVLVLMTFVSIACATAPFEGAAGRFDPARVEAFRGRRVYVPEGFIRRHERHRFLLPGARIESYDPLDADVVGRLLEQGHIVVVQRGLGESETGPFRVMARRLVLTSRHSLEQMWRIGVYGELDLLVRQELVVRRFRPERERNR